MIHTFLQGPWAQVSYPSGAAAWRNTRWSSPQRRYPSFQGRSGYYPTYNARRDAEPSLVARHYRYRMGKYQ